MKILIIQDDEDFEELDQCKQEITEVLGAVVSLDVRIVQPDTAFVAFADISDDDALKVVEFDLGAAGHIAPEHQLKLRDTLNWLTSNVGVAR